MPGWQESGEAIVEPLPNPATEQVRTPEAGRATVFAGMCLRSISRGPPLAESQAIRRPKARQRYEILKQRSAAPSRGTRDSNHVQSRAGTRWLGCLRLASSPGLFHSDALAAITVRAVAQGRAALPRRRGSDWNDEADHRSALPGKVRATPAATPPSPPSPAAGARSRCLRASGSAAMGARSSRPCAAICLSHHWPARA